MDFFSAGSYIRERLGVKQILDITSLNFDIREFFPLDSKHHFPI